MKHVSITERRKARNFNADGGHTRKFNKNIARVYGKTEEAILFN